MSVQRLTINIKTTHFQQLPVRAFGSVQRRVDVVQGQRRRLRQEVVDAAESRKDRKVRFLADEGSGAAPESGRHLVPVRVLRIRLQQCSGKPGTDFFRPLRRGRSAGLDHQVSRELVG